MKSLITSQVFPPEVHPSGVMMKELASDLAKYGWESVVVTGFPNHPHGLIFDGFRRKIYYKEKIDGFNLIRSWHMISPSSKLINRGLTMISYGLSFILSALLVRKADIVIGGAPPLIGPIASLIIAKLYKARFLFVLFDIYPDILIDLGLLKNRTIIRLLKLCETFTYRCSDHIVVLSEGFRRTLIEEKGVDPQKVTVIPVWLDFRDIIPMSRDNSWRREMGISPKKFVVLYAGTIGIVSGAEVVVEAAKDLGAHQDILFLFVGAGHARDRVEAKAREAGLRNMRFLPFQPRERLSEVQATADVSLVTLAPGRGKTSVPSKVLGYMAAARPVIAAVDENCDTEDLVRKAQCGLVVPPGEGKALAEAILYFYQNQDACRIAGRSGYRYFLNNLERKLVINRFLDEIVSLNQK